MNETNLAQHFTSNFLVQFVYQQTDENSFIQLLLVYEGVIQMFDLYVNVQLYLLVLKSIILVQRMQDWKTQPAES